MRLEEDGRINRGPTLFGIQLPDPVADKRQVELRFEVAVEVIWRNEFFQRDDDRLVEAASRSDAGQIVCRVPCGVRSRSTPPEVSR